MVGEWKPKNCIFLLEKGKNCLSSADEMQNYVKNCVSGHPDGWKIGKTVFRGTPTGRKTEKTAQIRE